MEIKIVGSLILLAGLVASWILVGRRDRRDRQHALDHMAKNPPLTPAEFGARYFPAAQADLARRLRELLVPHLAVDLARLGPDDRLVDDLRMDALDSFSTVEYLLAIEQEFGVSIPEADAANVRTLRDLVALVEKKLAVAAR